jgi:integrase/recombinase XerD
MTTILQEFKNYLYQVGYSESIRYMMPMAVSEFIHHQQITDTSYVEQQKVRSFYEWLQIRPLKRRSGALSEKMIYDYMYALKTFFTWLEVTGQADYNPISGMKFKGPKTSTRQPLTVKQVEELFAAAITLKETAVLHIFYSCGLRKSEGEALDIHDIHFREQLLYVREGKGAKRRVVPITQKVAADLENYYLNDRCSGKVKNLKDEDAFILNKAGSRMSGQTYGKLLKRLLHKAGIMEEVGLHHLRHSIATHLLQGGMSLEYVRDFLGHRHLESTQVYAKPDAEQLKLL